MRTSCRRVAGERFALSVVVTQYIERNDGKRAGAAAVQLPVRRRAESLEA